MAKPVVATGQRGEAVGHDQPLFGAAAQRRVDEGQARCRGTETAPPSRTRRGGRPPPRSAAGACPGRPGGRSRDRSSAPPSAWRTGRPAPPRWTTCVSVAGDLGEEREADHLVEQAELLGLGPVPRTADQRQPGRRELAAQQLHSRAAHDEVAAMVDLQHEDALGRTGRRLDRDHRLGARPALARGGTGRSHGPRSVRPAPHRHRWGERSARGSRDDLEQPLGGSSGGVGIVEILVVLLQERERGRTADRAPPRPR